MAIQKTKVLPSGIEGNYWRMASVHIDTTTCVATYYLSLHKDFDNRWSPPILFKTKKYEFVLTLQQLETANLRVLGYQKILEKAATMVPPLFGREGDELVQFDSDLADGLSV